MGVKTKIEWSSSTWNPIRGCSRISEGCVRCYAERIAHRFNGEGQPYEGLTDHNGRWNGQIMFVEEKLDEPLHWTKPRLIFVNSMSDLFHENLTDHQIERIHDVMRRAPQHRYQILTKRADRMVDYYKSHPGDVMLHLWYGISVEHQQAAQLRVPELLKIRHARGQHIVRWLSVEPMLGRIELGAILREYDDDIMAMDALSGRWHPKGSFDPGWTEERIGWVVCGGESGADARPMDPRWAIELRDACGRASVPFFFKQNGEWAPASAIDPKREPADVERELRGRGIPRLHIPQNTHADPSRDTPGDGVVLWRVGKKQAGRMLDGRTWDGMPPWGWDG